MSAEQELERIRQEIDQIDIDILRLVSERARCAQEITEIKLGAVDRSEAMFYRPEREAQVLREIVQRNTGPLNGETVALLFREIMSACLALQQPLQIAYLGPEGTFNAIGGGKAFWLHGPIAATGFDR